MIKNISQKAKNKERYPEDWKVLKISDVADVKGGKRLPKGYSLQEKPNGYPYITVSDMYIGGISTENIKYVPEEVVDKIKNYRISTDDLFISVAGTLGIVGKVPESLNNANLTENADKLTNIKIDKEYLYQVLISDIIQKEIEKEKTTNAQPKLALTRIKNFRIPVPSNRNEIKKIALILSTWDKAIELKEKLIEQKKELKKGLMQKLLTGVVRLPEFNEDWEDEKVGNLIEEVNEKSTVNNQFQVLSVTKDGIVAQNEHFKKQIASENNIGYKIVKKNNLVFSTMNLWMGSLDVLTNYDVGIVSPAYKVFKFNSNKMLPSFGKYFMKSEHMIWLYNVNSEQGASIVRRNLDLKGLLNTYVKIPSIEEQKKIAKILLCLDREIDLLNEETEQIKIQKKGLMQLLLTGKVRVKV
jgi:type I restriction enzyme, S subunit